MAGETVEVTAGLSAGLKGIVTASSTLLFGDLPVYVVDLGGLLSHRCIRADYLRRVS